LIPREPDPQAGENILDHFLLDKRKLVQPMLI
jgi:hypothetical protein